MGRARRAGNQQLVQRTGLPKATVSRFTSTLLQLGYLRFDESSRKFFIGTRVLGMGASVQRNLGLQRIARPFMETLAEEADVTVTMGTRDRLSVVFLEVFRPRKNRLTVNTDVGSVLPLESTAIGLCYIVAAPLAERTRLLADLRRRHSDDWNIVRSVIEKAHGDFERQGFVTSQKSWGRDVNAVGAPFQLAETRSLFVFNCAGPSSQLPQQHLRNMLGPSLLDTLARIRQALAENPPSRLNPPSVHEP
jgi:DNA-binding IclR family transcriptional regulator